MKNESFFLKPKQAHEAFMDCVLPAILSTMESGRTERSHLHVVTLNPLVPYSPKSALPVLFEHSIDKKDWEYPYIRYARRKVALSWRTGLSSREVVLLKPHLLKPGDSSYWGSAIIDGIPTGCSGVDAPYDEMFARMTSAALSAEASIKMKRMKDDGSMPDFFPKK